MRVVILFCLVFIGLCIAEPIHTVEGIWTDSFIGGKNYICVDDTNNVWATFSEAGVLWGRTSLDKTIATGTWYTAGNAISCTSGPWQAIVYQEDPDTLEISYYCEENTKQPFVSYNEKRLADSANNADCNVVTQEASFEGTWGNKLLGVEDLVACVNGNEAQASIVTDQETFVYVYGASYNDDRIFTGRWFSDEPNGIRRNGPYLFFPLNTQDAVQIFWTGDEINYEQDIDNPRNHRMERGIKYRSSQTGDCDSHNYLVQLVSGTSNLIPSIAIITFTIILILF